MADAQIRVGSQTAVASLASAIANRIYEGNTVVLQMIGAAAISQGVKAIAVASSFTAMPPRYISLSAKPVFEDVLGEDGHTVTRMLIKVYPDKT
jgi:stage V sporulation protein S